jgi:D-alanyl-D-alanine carboxypeptidase
MSDSEPDAPPPPKAKATDKQMANLRKGMEALKAKREALAKEKEVFEEKQKKGEIPADAPKPKLAPAPKKPKVVVVSPPPAEPEVIYKERKKQERKAKIAVDDVKGELAALRAELSALKAPAVVKEVEKIVEKPVDRVVEKTKVLSGSEMLNAIFFK